MKYRVEAHQCPVHRWTTEIHRDRCGVRDASGTRCGERFAASYTFLPTHEHDEALSDLRGRHWKERHAASPAPPVVSEEGREFAMKDGERCCPVWRCRRTPGHRGPCATEPDPAKGEQ
jgi:hypothetical protein